MLTEEQEKLKSEAITNSLKSLKELTSNPSPTNIYIISELRSTVNVLSEIK